MHSHMFPASLPIFLLVQNGFLSSAGFCGGIPRKDGCPITTVGHDGEVAIDAGVRLGSRGPFDFAQDKPFLSGKRTKHKGLVPRDEPNDKHSSRRILKGSSAACPSGCPARFTDTGFPCRNIMNTSYDARPVISDNFLCPC